MFPVQKSFPLIQDVLLVHFLLLVQGILSLRDISARSKPSSGMATSSKKENLLLAIAIPDEARTGPHCKANEEYPGPREGRVPEEHLGLAENSLGQGTNELTIIS